MQHRNLNSIKIISIVLLFLTACNPDPKVDAGQLDNYYFVKVGNIALPVRLCGNINSDIAVIYVHGGPGGSAQSERGIIYWKEIEKYYKVVYWDQRGSGITQGNASSDDMTIEQFSEDLDNIVDFTKAIGKTKTVFLHGASWGGGLTSYYLLDTLHQKKINGAILEAPAYDIKNGVQLSVQWMVHKADSMLALNNNLDYWNNCKLYYAEHPVLTYKEFKQHQNYLNQVKGIAFNTGNIQTRPVSIPNAELALLYNNAEFAPASLTYQGNSIFTHLDLTTQLHQINVPVLLVWGALDGLLPRNNLAQKFIINVGSTDVTYNPAKYLFSAHLPHAEDWQQMNTDAKIFIESHK